MKPDQNAAERLLYRLMAENRQHARLSEDRRIAISCVTTIVATATAIALPLLPLGVRILPLTLWLTLVGIFGTLSCLKLYERAQLHERRARALRAKLAVLAEESQVEELQAETEAAHIRQHPRLSAIRFNSVLSGLNVAITLLGIFYTVLDLVQR